MQNGGPYFKENHLLDARIKKPEIMIKVREDTEEEKKKTLEIMRD